MNIQGEAVGGTSGSPIGFQCFKKYFSEFVQCHEDKETQDFSLNESNLHRSKEMDILDHIGHSLFFPDPPYSYGTYSFGK